MRLYSRGTFGKDAHQWTKCVVKYLTDIYGSEHLHVITLLLEVCELTVKQQIFAFDSFLPFRSLLADRGY